MKYIYHTLTFTSLSSSSSLMHNFLHSKRLHKVTWHKTYIFYTYNNTYNYTIIFPIHLSDITYTNTNYLHEMPIFHTYYTAMWHMFICTIIKTKSNYRGWSSFHNNTSYIHQDIPIHLTPYWLQQQITLPIKYKLYMIHNSYLLELSIKSSFRHTNYNIHLLIHDIC